MQKYIPTPDNDDAYTTNCDESYTTSYKYVVPHDSDSIGSVRICSFDIECNSSHGDFPLAVKDYTKVARQLVEHFTLCPDALFYKNTSGVRAQEIAQYLTEHVFVTTQRERRVYTKNKKIPKNDHILQVATDVENILKPYAENAKLRERTQHKTKVVEKITNM